MKTKNIIDTNHESTTILPPLPEADLLKDTLIKCFNQAFQPLEDKVTLLEITHRQHFAKNLDETVEIVWPFLLGFELLEEHYLQDAINCLKHFNELLEENWDHSDSSMGISLNFPLKDVPESAFINGNEIYASLCIKLYL